MAADPGTLRQFAEHEREQYCAENPRVSKAQHRRFYPVASYRSRWIGAIREGARASVVLSRWTLDALWREDRLVLRGLFHDYPDAIPDGYLNPEVRRRARQKRSRDS